MFHHFLRIYGRYRFIFLALLGILLLVPVISPLCHARLINERDIWAAFMRLVGLLQCWQDGRFLGTWVPELYYGQGYPILHYYAPLFSYIAGICTLLLKDPVLGMNVALVIIFLLSGVAMFLFARDLWGNVGGFLSAVAYIYAPYHIQEVYSSGACAAFTSYLFLPLILWAIRRCFFSPEARWVLLLAVSWAGLILSHNLTAVMGILLGGFYAVFLVVFRKGTGFALAGRRILIGVTAGFGLSSFFWLPVAFERGYVQLSQLTGSEAFDYKSHFLSLVALLKGAWEIPGHERGFFYLQTFENILILLGMGWVAVLMLRARKPLFMEIVFFGMANIVLLHLVFGGSSWFWGLMKPMAVLQFPWRFLVPVTMLGALLVGGIAARIRLPAWRYGLIGAVGLFLIITGYGAAHPRSGYMDEGRLPFKTEQSILAYRKLPSGEYREFLFFNHAGDSADFLPKSVRVLQPHTAPLRVASVQGQATVTPSAFVPGFENRLNVITPKGALLCFMHFYFPGWEVFVDGMRTRVSSDNPWGYIVFAVPPGTHDVLIRFGSTIPRTVGQVISLLFLTGGFLLLAYRWWKMRCYSC